MTRINSCNKGKVGERQAAALLRTLGFPMAKRTAQHKGTTDSSDVDGVPLVYLEVKYLVGNFDFGTKAMRNALHRLRMDCPTQRTPVLLWKARGGRAWLVTWPGQTCWLTTDNVLAGIKAAQCRSMLPETYTPAPALPDDHATRTTVNDSPLPSRDGVTICAGARR